MSNIIDKIQISGVTYDLVGGGSGGSNIAEVTQAEYDALVSGGTVDPNTLYIITDAPTIDMNDYVTKVANVANVAIITASTSNNTRIVPQYDGGVLTTGVTTFYLKGGTSGSYCQFYFGRINNGNYGCCYNGTFYWGNTFTISYGTASYDSETDIYTITANEGYAFYDIYVNNGTFTIFTEPLTFTGQSAKVIGDSIPVVIDVLSDKIAASDFNITTFELSGNGLRLVYKKGSSTYTPTLKLSDDSSVFTNGAGKLYTKPVTSTTSSEVEMMTDYNTCYTYFNSTHDGVTNTTDDYWNTGVNSFKFHINSNYTNTYNRTIQFQYGYSTTKTDYYNGASTLYIYYRYSGSSIVYSIGNSSNYSNDYSGLTTSIKNTYNLDIKLESSAITYTKEDQQHSGYYYWIRNIYFNVCQYIPSRSTTFLSSATYSTNDVLQHDALQTVFDAYESGLKAVKISQSDYDTLVLNGTVDENTVYFIGDSSGYTMKLGTTNVTV